MLHRKTWLFVAIGILANVTGNSLLAYGLRGHGGALAVALGIPVLAAAMFSQMLLLSWADLSYVLPLSSIGYALTAFVGHFVLGEDVSAARWIGVAAISLGVALVSPTPARTTPQELKR
jgi:multidrug transporter EmrE-like cation transporter